MELCTDLDLVLDSGILNTMDKELEKHESSPFKDALRTAEFWRRASGVYMAYKGAQVKAAYLQKRGWDTQRIREQHWLPHHAW